MKRWIVNTDLNSTNFAEELRRQRGGVFKDSGGLSDPRLMLGMDEACAAIRNALRDDANIVVFGDYDCDGVTGTVLLYSYLFSLGANVSWYIPTRDEGYGMSLPAAERLANGGAELIITVDNGISAVEEAAFLAERGVSLVITDHHQPPAILPIATAIVDPHQPGDNSPYKDLCGCAVALKLVMCLENDPRRIFDEYGALAALATIADIVPLTGENRYIVREGLPLLQDTELPGLRSLMAVSGLIGSGKAAASSLAFTVIPRINVAGRTDSAAKVVELLLCEDNFALANAKAEELTLLNNRRKDIENLIIAEALRQIADEPRLLYEPVLVVAGAGWHAGVIGIVASRLQDTFDKPVFVISIGESEEETARGSARSYDGFNVHDALSNLADLFIKYGGHARAGGFSLNAAQLPELRFRLSAYCAEKYRVFPAMPQIADIELNLSSELSPDIIGELDALEPFGEANPKPVFFIRRCKLINKEPLKGGKYLKLLVSAESTAVVGSYNKTKRAPLIKVLCFSMSYEQFGYNNGDELEMMVNLATEEYNGNISVSAKLQDVRLAGMTDVEDRYFAALDIYHRIKRGEKNIDVSVRSRVEPDEAVIKAVYDLFRGEKAVSVKRACESAVLFSKISACAFCLALDILCEAGLIERVGGDFARIARTANTDSKKKTDLSLTPTKQCLAKLWKGVTSNA